MYLPKVNKSEVDKTIEYVMNPSSFPEIDEYGNKYWVYGGVVHRDNGPAIVYSNGRKYWYQHGFLHREDGPAVMYPDGTKFYNIHGKRHREDGPAVMYPDGKEQYWIHGKELTKEEWEEYVRSKNKS